ncbi:MAG: glycosyltransferase family 2 protein, partial [Clostridia bacterium]|nr:glycosyltransferase family 2 protein [Clostridia bacterium]
MSIAVTAPNTESVRTDLDYGLVSVIMPNYNSEKYIKETVESVLQQTYSHWELLFIDDASTDGSLAIAKSFHDPRIRILQNPSNMGAAATRNVGIEAARGKWIAFLDSDDLWHPEKLSTQLGYMVENGYDFT